MWRIIVWVVIVVIGCIVVWIVIKIVVIEALSKIKKIVSPSHTIKKKNYQTGELFVLLEQHFRL